MAGGGAWSKISSIFFQDEEEDSTFLFSSSQVDLAGQIMDPEVQAFSGADGGQGGGFSPWRR